MKKKYLKPIVLPFLAIAVGFLSAYFTANVHSMIFVLLPLLAFVLGYFSSWSLGLLCGLLLFMGYSFEIILLQSWNSDNKGYHDYLMFMDAFLYGGFLLLIIGASAPVMRRAIRKRGIHDLKTGAVLIVLAVSMLFCGSLAWANARTDCRNNYGFHIIFPEDIDVELYLPAGAISGVIEEDLYKQLDYYPPPAFVDTEHGRMMKYTFSKLYPYSFDDYSQRIVFWAERDSKSPRKLVKLIPRYDVVPINEKLPEGFSWPPEISGGKLVETFSAPIKVKASTDIEFTLFLWNITLRNDAINFNRCYKDNNYAEIISYTGRTSDEWVIIPVEVLARQGIEVRSYRTFQTGY